MLSGLGADPAVPEVGLVLGYVALLWMPGVAVGAVVGLRGWSLAALAPLLTYGLAAVSAPWMSRWGAEWTPTTAGFALLTVLVVVTTLRWPIRRWAVATPRSVDSTRLPMWTAGGHFAVALAVAAAAIFGANVLLIAFGGLGSIPQDWDAMLHANGIRYIAETGAGGVYGMLEITTFASDAQLYYPHAYHLIAALIFELSGMTIPAVLNAHSMIMPLMLALALVALIRSFHGRVALAMFAAIISPMATAIPYDLLWRGPLYPFATGVLLSFAALVALHNYLGRPSVLSALPLILCAAGLIGLHPSTLITAVLFSLPLLAQRWLLDRRRGIAEVGLLAIPALLCSILVIPHLVGALSVADQVAGFTWPQTMTPAHALGEVFGFSTEHAHPQYWLVVFFAVGTFAFQSLGQLRWVPVAAVGFVAVYTLAAAYDRQWAHTITSIWWNDKWRLAAIATMALLPVVAHGLVRTYELLLGWVVLPGLRQLSRGRISYSISSRPAWTAGTSMAGVLLALLLLTNYGYLQRNLDRASLNYGPGRTVGVAELEAFDVLERLVQPGQRVMNDRFDGSGWMYALTGVRPVAAHFSRKIVGEAPQLLAAKFDSYDTNLSVRNAAARLNVQWVMVGPGFVRGDWMHRQPGLDELEQLDSLRLVYDRAGVRIYKLTTPAEPSAPSPLPSPPPRTGTR